ncbi:hypothetical protein BD410DRAFT_828349 [Rickenella mellea]|uniref:Uncharacterized protein n=1 Tax=Rickenella mellea TaxID=50990 RepID=A0A4Y7Q4R7_9AGAM|nr:hypothetical protein BD410DRAFT_828349 [Rickenella mellea]
MLGVNKPRIYMALYARGQIKEGQVKYHTSLLLAPKNPDTSTRKEQCVQYHVVNKIEDGVEVWKFLPTRTMNRVETLRSVALLGKVSISESSLRSKLEKAKIAQGDKPWRCRHWVWAAIQTLVAENIIVAPPLAIEELWTLQCDYTYQKEYDPDAALPCIDNAGQPMDAEIGPMP